MKVKRPRRRKMEMMKTMILLSELESVEVWNTKLTDVGQFSYGALCAICLQELYSDVQWQRYAIFVVFAIDRTIQSDACKRTPFCRRVSNSIFGLSFERPYLMQGRKLIVRADYGQICGL